MSAALRRPAAGAGRAPGGGQLGSRVVLALALMNLGCAPEGDPFEKAASPEAGGARRADPPALFRDVTDDAGIDFTHVHGGTGRKYLPEIMGSGGAALDYDGDGRVDLYFVQAGPVPGAAPAKAAAPVNQLWRNVGKGANGSVGFENVTERAGAGATGYGMGALAGDYDNDGDADLYVVNFGPDRLLRNNGDGTFTDATSAAGIDSPLWGSSAAFFDPDLDGDLDLYVVNYLDFTTAKHVDCGRGSVGIFAYCHPDVYEMAPDVFFRNTGATPTGAFGFADATRAAGLADTTGKGLGVVAADFTADGWPDLYVANDSTPNFLYRNLSGGVFEEVGLELGVGYNEEGLTEAGMGAATGDVDGDGDLDLFVTNLSNETNALYVRSGDFFTYATREAGLYAPSYIHVGFGAELADLDNDGDLDLLVANGHVIDNVETIDDAQSFRQPTQVFWNDGTGGFQELTPEQAGELARPRVGRGTIGGDFDRDGRRDVLITFNNDRARLFRNEWPDAGEWVAFTLSAGAGVNRDGVGSRLRVEAGGRGLAHQRIAGSSYQTSGDPALHFGLADSRVAETIRLRWPNGRQVEYRDLPAGRFYRLEDVEIAREGSR